VKRGSSSDKGVDYPVGYGRPPVETRFPKGQSGCPGGRGGKPRIPVMASTYDEKVLEAFNRVVTTADGKKVSLVERALQQDALNAAKGDEKANARLRPEYARASSNKAAMFSSMIGDAMEHWIDVKGAFDDAERKSVAPPDFVPHPDHVHITDTALTINGPCTKEERAFWEYLKFYMRFWSDAVALVRADIKKHPDYEFLKNGLRIARAKLEHFRRHIPKGWNWKEQIYTLDSAKEDIEAYEKRQKQGRTKQ
jgi:hypothetical protein